MISRSQKLLPRLFLSSFAFPMIFILSGCDLGEYSISLPDKASRESLEQEYGGLDQEMVMGIGQEFLDAYEQYSNQHPNAKITASLNLTSGEPVTLDASGSFDPDGDTLSYHWTQTEGPYIDLSGASTATLNFVMPVVTESTLLSFQLTVGDGYLSSTASLSFQLSPSATSTNRQPQAVITAEKSFFSGEVVTLDGSGSNDPDGDTLSYYWTRTEGPDTGLLGASTATLSFVAPTVSETTQFTYQLIVGDGVLTSTASVSIQVMPPKTSNNQPQAMIIAPKDVTSGQTVTLDGSSSYDPDEDVLSYKWMQTSGPDITLSDSTSSSLTFVAPTVTQNAELTFELTVHDGKLSSTTSVSMQLSPIAGNTSCN